MTPEVVRWQKSTKTTAENCVRIGYDARGFPCAVDDSKNPGAVLTGVDVTGFLRAVKRYARDA